MSSLLKRFLDYVRIDTQSDEHSLASPSTSKQLVLSQLLEKECRSLKLHDVSCSERGVVIATIPATSPHATETIVWNAHIDTSPEYSGANVHPIVHNSYDGKDIFLPGDPTKIIRLIDNPALKGLIGTTIITTDGTTLLGADDKAGVAVIMTAAEYLQSHPNISHGPIKVCFTVDEEIGRGTEGLDIEKLNAVCGYTLDGGSLGSIETETFSANLAIITVDGVNAHPSEAKAKGMVSAIKILARFLTLLPPNLTPELTDGREGFLHPYAMEGGVAKASVRIILRDFETPNLDNYAKILKEIAQKVNGDYPQALIRVEIKKQYRNMGDGLKKEPRAVSYALKAMHAAGIEPRIQAIRGGTDGALMTEKGLPCPNLFCGQHNLHSPLEWASLFEMEKSVEMLIQLAEVWAADTHNKPLA